jgi:hypothetical protein
VPRSLGLVNRLLPPCMLLTPPLGEEQLPVPLPSVSVGGRLIQCLHHWEKFTTDVCVWKTTRKRHNTTVSNDLYIMDSVRKY